MNNLPIDLYTENEDTATASTNLNKAMDKEASNESNEDSESAGENSDEEDDRKMPAITSNAVRKRTKHKKSQEGNNQS
eukprot:scaffold89682_cov47-Attheya_sp.AAC.1